MKYNCPQCGNVFLVHWYDNTQNIKCSQCELPVFEPQKKRLRILNGLIGSLTFLVPYTISKVNHLELLGTMLVFVAVAAILLSMGTFIEGILCRDLRVK